jgi:hypothetical protein
MSSVPPNIRLFLLLLLKENKFLHWTVLTGNEESVLEE